MATTVPSYNKCAKKCYLPASDPTNGESRRHAIWRGFQGFPYAYLLLSTLLLTSCVKEYETVSQLDVTDSDPLTTTDSFVMRNTEIREDLLEQLHIHGIEHWINSNGSIGFYVRDTKEVDRLANEAIGVYISLQ